MKTKKRNVLLMIIILIMGVVLTSVLSSCKNDLDKTIEDAVADDKITDQEAQDIHNAFDNADKKYSLEKRIKYVSSKAPNMSDKDIRDALTIVSPPQQKSVFVYLDNTESMRGYMNATDASKFARVLTAINDYYSKDNITSQAFYTEATNQNGQKNTQVVGTDFSQLRSDLTAHSMNKFTDSYQLNNFFDEVTRQLLSNPKHTSICFFVTDGIPSGTNEEISRSPGRRFSISQKEELQSRIAGALRPLGAKGGFGAAIFQFFAPFKGQYWKYNNDNRTILNDHERPFYVFAVGQKELLKDFLEQVKDGLSFFEPHKAVAFLEGDKRFGPSSSDGYLNKKDNKENDFYFDADQANKNAGQDDNAPTTLCFKLDGFPHYLRDESMLKAKVMIEVEGNRVTPVVKPDRIDFTVKASKQGIQKVRIVVEDFLPSWVSTSSTPDDSNLSPNNRSELNKTFNLDILVRGIEQGIFNKGGETNAIDRTFILDGNDPGDDDGDDDDDDDDDD